MVFKSVNKKANKKERDNSNDIAVEEEINDNNEKLSSSTSPWKDEVPQRYGTLTLVPMSSLLSVTKKKSGYSSNNSNNSKSRKRKKTGTYYNSDDSDDGKGMSFTKFKAEDNDKGDNTDGNDMKIKKGRLRKGGSPVSRTKGSNESDGKEIFFPVCEYLYIYLDGRLLYSISS
jgi:hypothetical protein